MMRMSMTFFGKAVASGRLSDTWLTGRGMTAHR